MNTQIQSIHFSSASDEWRTPPWLFAQLNAEFHFGLDAAASKENTLLPKFYAKEDVSLQQSWDCPEHATYCNPPYGREIGPFVAKGLHETWLNPALTVVMLIPARTDTAWWHEYVAKGEVRLLRGRLKFLSPIGAEKEVICSAPFPSALVIFGALAKPGVTHVTYKEER